MNFWRTSLGTLTLKAFRLVLHKMSFAFCKCTDMTGFWNFIVIRHCSVMYWRWVVLAGESWCGHFFPPLWLSDFMLVTWNQPCGRYFYHKNAQMLQIRTPPTPKNWGWTYQHIATWLQLPCTWSGDIFEQSIVKFVWWVSYSCCLPDMYSRIMYLLAKEWGIIGPSL